MCKKFQIVRKNKLGEIYFCYSCNLYQVFFNNIRLRLTENQLNSLKAYMNCVDANFWESQIGSSNFNRKIPIPTFQESFVLIFTKNEFDELKNLLDSKLILFKLLSSKEIDYQQSIN